MTSLAGMPLRYLIGRDADAGVASTVTVVGYDTRVPPTAGIGVKYANLRDEKNSGRYAPYLPPDDISAEYGEPAPDPDHPGFWRNLDEQLRRAEADGFYYVELDNLDTYDAAIACECFDRVDALGLAVAVKNPILVAGDRSSLARHRAAALVVVERNCGTPAALDVLRRIAGRPTLPVRFVAYGAGLPWAEATATAIRRGNFVDMGVSYSPAGEYASSVEVLAPVAPVPIVRIETTGDVRVVVDGQNVTVEGRL